MISIFNNSSRQVASIGVRCMATTSVTVQELRVARKQLSNTRQVKPCTAEMEAFLSAAAKHGEDAVPAAISKRLTDCMSQEAQRVKPASLHFHLSKFVRRKKK